MPNPPFRVAVIGCGAISQTGHFPALKLLPDVRLVSVVDRSEERAKSTAKEFGAETFGTDITSLLGKVDGAIIATPPGSHDALACELLRNGIHVLVEKPMANDAASCQRMVDAAAQTGNTLAVGMIRRFYWADRFVKNALQSGILGDITEFRIENGYPFTWPSATPFILSKKEAGGGVLMGLGSHVLDTLLWWFGSPSNAETWTDAHGGLDSECLIHFTMPNGARGTVELSRSRTLANSATIRGTRGTIHAPFYGNRVELLLTPSNVRLSGVAASDQPAIGPAQDVATVMAEQIVDWIEASRMGRPPAATGQEALASIALIESCYANQREMDLPWSKPLPMPALGGASNE